MMSGPPSGGAGGLMGAIAKKAGGPGMTDLLGGPNGPGPKQVGPDMGSTPEADNMMLQDFLANPQPDLTDAINAVKALVRSRPPEGGMGTPPPMAPAPMASNTTPAI